MKTNRTKASMFSGLLFSMRSCLLLSLLSVAHVSASKKNVMTSSGHLTQINNTRFGPEECAQEHDYSASFSSLGARFPCVSTSTFTLASSHSTLRLLSSWILSDWYSRVALVDLSRIVICCFGGKRAFFSPRNRVDSVEIYFHFHEFVE